ncbi:MAG: nucleoside recognition domain-containing protein [Alphaproteobacteria bacterium]
MLNKIWFSFFMSAFLAAVYQSLFIGDLDVWTRIVQSTFVSSKSAFELSIGLTGTLCLWLGLLRIAEKAGLVDVLARFLTPLFKRLMPDLPAGHPAMGSMMMNCAANMLGLDNAATPVGIRAMEELQELNPEKDTASNAQILFMVMNTSSVTLLPVTIFMYRAQLGSANPTSVFIPILLATSISTLVGILSVAFVQKIKIFDRVVFSYFAAFSLIIASIGVYFSGAGAAQNSAVFGNCILFTVITSFLFAGWLKKVNVYEAFIEGAKGGFDVAVRLIPFIVAMLVSIAVLRASGVLEGILFVVEEGVRYLGIDTGFVAALPTAIMKPLSGSGARAMMIETIQTHGVDSFPATLSAIIQGSTETTFYVLAVYFGAVGIKKVRHALACSLLADAAGILSAILIGYWFFG